MIVGMGIPQVVIVGRPNVGKSSIFNWLAGKRLAIVDPTAGVTRDRVTQLIEFGGRFAELVDTGGMGIKDVDNLTEQVEDQIQVAIDVGPGGAVRGRLPRRAGAAGPGSGQAAALHHVPVLCVVNKVEPRRWTPRPTSFIASGGRWCGSAPRRTGARRS